MTRDELDQKYTSAGATHEEYRRWINRLADDTEDSEVMRGILSTMGQMESILMGIYAELVYSRHTTPVVRTVDVTPNRRATKKVGSLAELQKRKRRN
jgi:hypothetical protein